MIYNDRVSCSNTTGPAGTPTEEHLRALPDLPDSARGWAVYARLSSAKTGRAKRRRNHLETVERQIAEITAFAAQRGIAIDKRHIYIDNHLSAWARDGKRPDFDKMIAAALNGAFVGILVWKIDRFTRRTCDALWFIDLYEKHHTLINGPMSGEYDMSTPGGRRKLRDDASEAEHESDTIGARVRSRFEKARLEGLMLGGGRVFGYELLSEAREFDDDVHPIQRPAEVAVIREVAARALDGEQWVRIAEDLNARGITTTKGSPWHDRNLSRMVSAPYHAGYITLAGEIIGKLETVPGPNGTTVPYEPVLDEQTYTRLQALRAKSKRGRRPRGHHKLTGVITCGRCGHAMCGGSLGQRELKDESMRLRYVCPRRPTAGGNPGCGLSIAAVKVEERVREEVLKAAADPGVRAVIAEGDRAQDTARAELRRHIGDADAEIARLGGEIADLELRRIRARRSRDRAHEDMMAALDELVAEQQAKRYEYMAELGDDGDGPAGDLPELTGEKWEAMSGEDQRGWIRRLGLTITVHPMTPGAPRTVFDPDRITVE